MPLHKDEHGWLSFPPGTKKWRTDTDGTVVYPDGDVPIAGAATYGDLSIMRRVVELYGTIVLESCNRFQGVPIGWAYGMIRIESGTDPRAVSKDGGVGAMQITHEGLKRNHTLEQLLDPKTNIDIGVGLLHGFWAKGVRELPVAASLYNAGGVTVSLGSPPAVTYEPHPSLVSPWGMAETPGHIGRVVLANNAFYALARGA